MSDILTLQLTDPELPETTSILLPEQAFGNSDLLPNVGTLITVQNCADGRQNLWAERALIYAQDLPRSYSFDEVKSVLIATFRDDLLTQFYPHVATRVQVEGGGFNEIVEGFFDGVPACVLMENIMVDAVTHSRAELLKLMKYLPEIEGLIKRKMGMELKWENLPAVHLLIDDAKTKDVSLFRMDLDGYEHHVPMKAKLLMSSIADEPHEDGSYWIKLCLAVDNLRRLRSTFFGTNVLATAEEPFLRERFQLPDNMEVVEITGLRAKPGFMTELGLKNEAERARKARQRKAAEMDAGLAKLFESL